MLRQVNGARLRLLWGLTLAACMASPSIARAEPLAEPLAQMIYGLAEGWVRTGEAPKEVLDLSVDDFAAVHVTLRQDGLAVGYATSAVQNPLAPIGPVGDPAANPPGQPARSPIMRHIASAVRDALRMARAADVALGALPEAVARDAFQTGDLVLDMQLATTPRRIDVQMLDQLSEQLVVGRDGLAMRSGANKWAWSFPGTALANRISLAGQFQLLFKQLDLPPNAIQRLAEADAPAVYRFAVIHIVRPRPGQPAIALTRGNVLLPATPPDTATQLALGRKLAAFLLEHQLADLRFTGTYRPSADRHTEPTASLEDAALACYALARWAALDVHDETERQRLTDHVSKSFDKVAAPLGSARVPAPGSPQTRLGPNAMGLVALLEIPGSSRRKDLRKQLYSRIWSMQGPDGRFRAAIPPSSPQATAPQQALATLALVRMYAQTRDPVHLRQAENALTALWRETDDRYLIGTLPWLAMAEFDLARIGRPKPGLLTLQRLCEALWSHQVRPINLAEDPMYRPDTVGGFALGGDLSGEPNWRSAAIVAAMAQSLRAENFVPVSERLKWLVNSNLGARFLAQLTVEPTSTWYMRNPQAALGGMRWSMTDNQMTLSASSMALLAIVELHESTAMFLQTESPPGP